MSLKKGKSAFVGPTKSREKNEERGAKRLGTSAAEIQQNQGTNADKWNTLDGRTTADHLMRRTMP